MTFKNLRVGHTPQVSGCFGGVFEFVLCQGIEMDNVLMYGCGTQGITAHDTKGLNCTNSIIEHCTYDALDLSNCTDFVFENIDIRDNDLYGNIIEINTCKNINFKSGHIRRNKSSEFIDLYGDPEGIVFDEVDIADNSAELAPSGICKVIEKRTIPSSDINHFVPKNHKIIQKIFGDLNKDGVEDCVLLVEERAKGMVYKGVIVLFKEGKDYQIADKNLNLMSEEELPPTQEAFCSISFKRGSFIFNVSSRKYGISTYMYRYQDGSFKLIGQEDVFTIGATVHEEISINYLTKKKLIRKNTDPYSDDDNPTFKETWENIEVDKLKELSDN